MTDDEFADEKFSTHLDLKLTLEGGAKVKITVHCDDARVGLAALIKIARDPGYMGELWDTVVNDNWDGDYEDEDY